MLLQPLIDFFSKTFGTVDLSKATQTAESSISTSPVGWVMGVGAIGMICVILFLLCFSWTKERVVQIDSEENVSIKKDLKDLFQMHLGGFWLQPACLPCF